jgi:DNA-binding response OmpR family regulator
MATAAPTLLHFCGREMILGLRDQIFRLHGYEVDSTLSADEALSLAAASEYSLVLIDVEGDGRIPVAEKLCSDIKTMRHGQNIAFICNYRISVLTDCPDEIIRSEFNPQAMVDGIKAILETQGKE